MHARSLLVIGQSNSPNEREFPDVDDEINAITGLIPTATILQPSAATHGAVREAIQECDDPYRRTLPVELCFPPSDGPPVLSSIFEDG